MKLFWNKGKKYINKKGKVIFEKILKEIICKCKYKCLNKIVDNKILEIF